MDQESNKRYVEQEKIITIITLMAFVALFVAIMGILAMTSFYILQKQNEIAIRKVYGSTESAIIGKLLSRFFYLLFVAFVIAAPISYVIMNRWLRDYSERIDLTAPLFLYPLLFIAVVTFLTIYHLCRKAAERNHALTLKS